MRYGAVSDWWSLFFSEIGAWMFSFSSNPVKNFSQWCVLEVLSWWKVLNGDKLQLKS